MPSDLLALDESDTDEGDLVLDAATFGRMFGAAVLAPVVEDERPELVTELLDEPSAELERVSSRIAGQYADVICRFGARAFAGTGSATDLDALVDAVTALRRLSSAVQATRQVALLDELLEGVAGITKGRAARKKALGRLQQWIPAFAETLPAEQGRQLKGLVQYEPGSLPLLEELRTLPGLGRRRLQRLYAAGLFTVEVVANAAPEDLAEVTGIPRALAADIVQTSQAFARNERERCLRAFREQATRLVSILRASSSDVGQLALLDAVQTLEQATKALESLDADTLGGGR